MIEKKVIKVNIAVYVLKFSARAYEVIAAKSKLIVVM